MNRVPATYIITGPNSDPGHQAILSELVDGSATAQRFYARSLDERFYWALLRLSDAMLGNSSSGIIEAPAVQLPVVNVGMRQKGRLRGANVVDVEAEPDLIVAGLHRALSHEFRTTLRGTGSPYGDGHATGRIVQVLEGWSPPRPPRKHTVNDRHGLF